MKLVFRFYITFLYSLDRFDRVRNASIFRLNTLKQDYRVAKPSSAKRIEKKIRETENALKNYYINLCYVYYVW